LEESRLPEWTPFQVATINGQHVNTICNETFSAWKNSRYTVLYRALDEDEDNLEGMVNVHLSIKRNDRKPVTSWRDLQAIKNAFCGPESEAVQLFPAESRLVDTANQTHLWCRTGASRFPFGYTERLVSETNVNGSIQEPFEPHTKPVDLDSMNASMSAAIATLFQQNGES
jgi:hypothetical protein